MQTRNSVKSVAHRYLDLNTYRLYFWQSTPDGRGTTGFAITLNNCAKDRAAVTAENAQSLLFDALDTESLRVCTIIENVIAVSRI